MKTIIALFNHLLELILAKPHGKGIPETFKSLQNIIHSLKRKSSVTWKERIWFWIMIMFSKTSFTCDQLMLQLFIHLCFIRILIPMLPVFLWNIYEPVVFFYFHTGMLVSIWAVRVWMDWDLLGHQLKYRLIDMVAVKLMKVKDFQFFSKSVLLKLLSFCFCAPAASYVTEFSFLFFFF